MSCNLICLICESKNTYFKTNYNLQQMQFLPFIIKSTIDHLLPVAKERLITYIKLNFNKININCRNDMFLFENVKRNIDKYQNEIENSTPSSPSPSSSLVNTLNYRENTLSTYFKLSLQISDPIIIKNCISKYNFSINNQNYTKGCSLRYFWSSWQKNILKVQNSDIQTDSNLINSSVLSNIIKLNNQHDMDFFYICFAKIIQLSELNKFDCAQKLIKACENIYNTSTKYSKMFTNLLLFFNINKYLNEFNSHKTNENTKKSQDQILKSCKSYLNETKKDSGNSK